MAENIRSGPNWMENINLYQNHTLAFFASSLRFRDIHISKFVISKMYFKVMTHNIHSGAIRWQMPDFLSDSNSNVCAISHRSRDISQINKNAKTLTLQMKIKVKERKNGTYAIRLKMSQSI